MNSLLVCMWLVIAGALMRLGWECIGRGFDWLAYKVSDRLAKRRRKALVERQDRDH